MHFYVNYISNCFNLLMIFFSVILIGSCETEKKDQPSDNKKDADALTGSESNPNINWITVPAGEFTFGSPEDTPCRAPIAETPVEVRLTRPFAMAESEITQAQWEALDFPNPSQNIGADKPVTFVNFFEALAWCNKLSRLEGFEPCYDLSSCKNPVGTGCGPEDKFPDEGCFDSSRNYSCAAQVHRYTDYYACPGYRLPTSVEWEYAAKAGTTGHTYNGDVHYVQLGECEEEPALEDIAWYCNNSGGELHPVKKKQANLWGLYDMLGNVYEYTDYYFSGQSLSTSTDASKILINPAGPITGETIDMRGGTFRETGCYDRPARPLFDYPTQRRFDTGFRPVRTLFGDEANSDAD